MGSLNRHKFQGVTNIIRFNWHFYVIALAIFLVCFFIGLIIRGAFGLLLFAIASSLVVSVLVSLLASWYVYDYSGLYDLDWLDGLPPRGHFINVNAGFDETSALLQRKYPNATLQVLDFYNPKKHTEVSIKRARQAYPPHPGTKSVNTRRLPIETGTTDVVLAILSAHEIRDETERTAFFKELQRIIRLDGKVVVVEHLRDLPNFLAYNIGFLHFHSKGNWLRVFSAAGLEVLENRNITPFIHVFILHKNGNTS